MSLISHRALQRWAANITTRRCPGIAASTHHPSTSKSCLTSKLTVGPLPASRIGAVLAQRRSFHQTSARRAVIIDLDLIAHRCIGAAALVYLFRHSIGNSTLPPHSWARTAHKQTRKEVEATMSMAFNMARSAPKHQKHAKLREATFHVPHELARLNKEAPRFRLEDLGPMGPGKLPWLSKDGPAAGRQDRHAGLLVLPRRLSQGNGRVLGGQLRADVSEKAEMQSTPVKFTVAWSRKPFILMRAFGVVYDDWEQNRPSVTDRIVETSRLPVICNFQENLLGCIFYPVRKMALDSRMGWTPLDVTDFDLRTSRF